MKKVSSIIAICSLSILLLGSFQTVSAQDSGKKLSYNFINEYGFFFGGDGHDGAVGISGVFVNSLKFNNTNDLLGIGVGYELSTHTGQCIPLYLNYRHYFSTNKKIMPLMNIAAGTLFNYWNNYSNTSNLKGNFGLYSTIAGGFKVSAFSFSSGFFLRTRPLDNNALYGGIEIKAGYTF